jgi:DNA invertase Pin-like site-specific DNA recombinase
VAEFERAMIREHQLEGIAKAKQAGKYRGRQSMLTRDQLKTIRGRVAASENESALAREFKLSRQTDLPRSSRPLIAGVSRLWFGCKYI